MGMSDKSITAGFATCAAASGAQRWYCTWHGGIIVRFEMQTHLYSPVPCQLWCNETWVSARFHASWTQIHNHTLVALISLRRCLGCTVSQPNIFLELPAGMAIRRGEDSACANLKHLRQDADSKVCKQVASSGNSYNFLDTLKTCCEVEVHQDGVSPNR